MSAVAPARTTPRFFVGFIEGRRGEILDAALAVFAEKGYEGGTMRDIAARVGVTEPALYRHFSGKQGLFATLIEEAGTRVRAEAIVLLDTMRPDDIRESLVAALQDRRSALRRYAPLVRSILVAASHDVDAMRFLRGSVVAPIVVRVRELAATVDAHFGIVRSNAERARVLRAFMSLFVGTVVTSLVLQDEPDAEGGDAMLRGMGWEDA